MKHQKLIAEFQNPDAKWRGKPFWSWNGELRAEELKRQVHVMKEMGLGGYFMHSRSGLITEYLGEDWFSCIRETAEEGIALGMENWLYDEDRWPSGSAGGMVTVDERYRMKSLRIHQMLPARYQPSDEDILVFYADLDGLTLHSYQPYTADAALPSPLGTWYVLAFRIAVDQPHSVFNGTTYIDTMNEEAVARFLTLTHHRYLTECGERLWDSIHGIFTDEPHRGHGMDNRKEEDGIVTCDMAYTNDLFERFLQIYGYDARDILPELFYHPHGNRVAQIKLHYFDLVCNLFDLRFAKQIQKWCNKNGISFTGHVLHEDALDHQTVQNGSLMRFYEYMDIPGIDVLSESAYTPWAVKQVVSVGRQLAKPMILSELYGCTGWQTNLRSHKIIGDWQAILGINLRCHHLSWYTMEGESKRDYPASILHQSAWYRDYDAVESYFARFGRVMSEGKPMCELLVLNPIESVWCQAYLGWANWIISSEPAIHKLNEHYRQLCRILLGNQIDYDYGEEQMLLKHAAIETDENGKAILRVGNMHYTTVLVSGMLTIRKTTLTLLHQFIARGGQVIFAGNVPLYVDALPSQLPAQLADSCIQVPFEAKSMVEALDEVLTERAYLKQEDGTAPSSVLLQIRKTDRDVFAALLNTDRDQGTGLLTVTVPIIDGWHCEEWQLMDGARISRDSSLYYSGGKATLRFSLDAAESAIFRFSSDHSEGTINSESAEIVNEQAICGSFSYRLSEENVCVLDFARMRLNGGEPSTVAEVLRLDDAARDFFGVERRHGEMIQPWYSKLHDNAVLGQVEIEYRFLIDILPEGKVYLAGERPFENAYAINGTPLTPLGNDDFWVDDAFKRMEIPLDSLHLGENKVTVHYDFRKTSNIEAVYLLGSFGVAVEEGMCRLTSLPLRLDPRINLDEQGLPFYGAEVTYLIPHAVVAPLIKEGSRAQVVFGKSMVGAIRVKCGDQTTRVLWEPYTADITDGILAGNDLEITAVLTRRNTFGPLHQLPAIAGAYDPSSFRTSGNAWTDRYVFVDSNLPKPLIRSLK